MSIIAASNWADIAPETLPEAAIVKKGSNLNSGVQVKWTSRFNMRPQRSSMMLAVGFLLFFAVVKKFNWHPLAFYGTHLEFRRVIIDIFPGFEVFAY